MDIQRINTTPRWSDVTAYGGQIYFVEVPADLGADITGQTQQVLAQAEATLALARSNKSRLLMVTIYVTDLANVAALNAVWDAWLPAGCAPVRACVKVELTQPTMLVEMAFTAAPA
jgi:enamine deaminase RidA (YjgF/YER057c/UK114 family)